MDTAHDVSALERRLGNPWGQDNPLCFAAVLAADEADSMLAAGESMLDELGFGAEFVPTKLGGRMRSLDRVMQLGRAVFRRDPSLGLGYGVSGLIAAVNVWAAGSAAQQRKLADLLLAGGKVACGYHELAHGNDLAQAECSALPADGDPADRLLLNGGKQVIANIDRAQALVLYARTAPGQGSRNHSLLLLDRDAFGQGRAMGRFATIGMRGVPLGGMQWCDVPVPAASLIGGAGQGLEIALKSFQVTRTLLPGMFIGILDTGLRCMLGHAAERRLYGRSVLDLPQTQAVAVDAWADIQLADSLVSVVNRGLHLAPATGSLYSAAAKYVVPKLLIESMTALSSVLGAQFYLRQGKQAIFQKLLRDLKPASFGHAGSIACLTTLLPPLPGLAKRVWARSDFATNAWFQLKSELPAFSFEPLALSLGGQDPLFASLQHATSHWPADHPASGLMAQLRDTATQLTQAAAQLTPADVGIQARSESHRLAARYAWLLAASACVNLHLQACDDAHDFMASDSVLAHPHWLLLMLRRIGQKLGWAPAPLDASTRAWAFGQLEQRFDGATSFDLQQFHLPGWDRAGTDFSMT